MKRLILIVLVLSSAAIATPVAMGGSEEIRVDAIFRNAGDLVEGQDVKIAGGVVGVVESIEVERRRFARIKMKIDGRFGPFHRDSRCDVKLASLIGENFIQCFPGSPDEPVLPTRDGAQVVSVKRTGTFVTPDVVFADLDMPQRERLRIILYELGISLAGRGEDLGDIVLQALPAVRNAKDFLAELDSQRDALGNAISSTDSILAELEPRKERIGEFIDQAKAVTARTARRSGEFRETIHELPVLLRKAEPAFADVAAIAKRGKPIVRNLRRASVPLRGLFEELGPFADAGRPALKSLGEAARQGKSALAAAKPVAKGLRPVAKPLPQLLTTANRTVQDLRDQGGIENLQRFLYYATSTTSRFDATSHIIPAHTVSSPCMQHHTSAVPTPDCSATLGETPAEPASRSARRPNAGRSRDSSDAATPPAGPRGRAPGTAHRPLLEPTPDGSTKPSLDPLSQLLDPLLGQKDRKRPSRPTVTDDLLDFLFGD